MTFCLTKELCAGLVWVERLNLLHMLSCHIEPLMWILFAEELWGDTLLQLMSEHTQGNSCHCDAVQL